MSRRCRSRLIETDRNGTAGIFWRLLPFAILVTDGIDENGTASVTLAQPAIPANTLVRTSVVEDLSHLIRLVAVQAAVLSI